MNLEKTAIPRIHFSMHDKSSIIEKSPTLTVITPVFNGEKYIRECLKNVSDQKCESYEHLVVDGGSSDGTIEILQEAAMADARVRWISEADRGQSDAMNKGIALARGSIIGFLNVDDFYSPEVLRRVCAMQQAISPPGFLCGNCRILNSEGNVEYVNRPTLKYHEMLFRRGEFPFNPSAYFYHKTLHNVVGLYDVNEHYVMDVDFLLRALRRTKCVYVPEDWGNMRYVPGTKTHQDNLEGRSKQRLNQLFARYQRQAGWGARFRYLVLPETASWLHRCLGVAKSKLMNRVKDGERSGIEEGTNRR